MRRKKISEPPVYQKGSNEPTLDPPPKWSVNAFKKTPKQKYNNRINITMSIKYEPRRGAIPVVRGWKTTVSELWGSIPNCLLNPGSVDYYVMK